MKELNAFIGPHRLPAQLCLPQKAPGLVVFAHGSGSGRMSPRNQHVAQSLQMRNLGTLLFDLLQPDEAEDRSKVFDIALLASRLGEALDWVDAQPDLAGLAVGLFGASTGAAAALAAAAERPGRVAAVVSRGGRPDLAGPWLDRVRAPTLLIVGGADTDVLALNHEAATRLGERARFEVVPRATHLFMEAGALERVAQLAADWFAERLKRPTAGA